MFYSLLGRMVWYGLKLFLRHKYGPTYVPKSLVAGGTVAIALAAASPSCAHPLRRRLPERRRLARLSMAGRSWPSHLHPPCPAASNGCPLGGAHLLRAELGGRTARR